MYSVQCNLKIPNRSMNRIEQYRTQTLHTTPVRHMNQSQLDCRSFGCRLCQYAEKIQSEWTNTNETPHGMWPDQNSGNEYEYEHEYE